jgi:small subunit ribosomal protein S16
MVKIRLARVGSRNRPKYRIVAANEQAPRNGAFIEIIGFYDPTQKPPSVELKKDRYEYWVSVGAATTPAINKLLETR